MRPQRLIPALFALLALLAPALSHAQGPESLRGTYTLNRQASDNVNQAIEAAVARMNFVTRPIARGRLRKTNTAYERLVISFPTSQVSIQFDARNAIVTNANGTPIKWRREDGEEFDVSTEWENGRLEQTFAAEDGRRVNEYTLSADGTLTMNVTITSPRLASPLRYKLVYNRAS